MKPRANRPIRTADELLDRFLAGDSILTLQWDWHGNLITTKIEEMLRNEMNTRLRTKESTCSK